MITEVELGFNQSDFYVTEGQNDTIDACVKITSGILQQNVTIHINTINKDHGGTMNSRSYSQTDSTFFFIAAALLSEDYIYKAMIPEKQLTFGPSISSACVPILVLNDDILESTENFTLVLSHSLEDLAAVSFSVQQATVEILEDTVDGM